MERPWLSQYPEGVPADIDVGGYDSLVALLDQACHKYARNVALVSLGHRLRYAELDRHADAVAAWLQSAGLPAGSRVALMMPNVMAYLVILLGVLRAGMVVVGVNPLYKERELEHQLRDSGARAIFILENFAPVLAEVPDAARPERVVLVSVGDLLGGKGWLVNFLVRHVQRRVPRCRIGGAVRFGAMLAQGAKVPRRPVAAAMDDVAVLQYTGGTTGVPKGAMLTHRNLVANILQVDAVARPVLRDEAMTIMTALPLYHVFALMVCGLFAVHKGMRSVLIADPRNLRSIVGAWRRDPAHIFPAVNTLFNGLAHFPAFSRLDFSALRLCFGGGAAVQEAVADTWRRVTGRTIIQGYGLSETSPLVCVNPTNSQSYSGDIGLPVPSTDVVMLDDAGRAQPYGSPGELAVHGPQVMSGYWERPDETADVFTADGFFRTGDIAVMSGEGRVRIVDRKKDLILVSGFNVYPAEVEEVVASHPGVLECAVVGVPDARTGEAVRLYVVRKDPALTADEVLAWCAERLAAYKRPHACEFRDALPKSNVGKILRRVLRDGALAASGA
ncbi:MAG: long-chain fatty acid--CoA ligase [Candidimonas sp.]|nr:MAG: long-chain fatty acid--CoA ligase [Candidimonas sp.]